MEILAVMLATVYWQVFNCYAILYSTFAFVIKKEIMYVFTVCFTGLQLGSNNKKPEPHPFVSCLEKCSSVKVNTCVEGGHTIVSTGDWP